tara:strand:+ start:1335 stop:1628 length:294 start_codon:yes stop_codon:yes gene_type:complete
MSEFDLVATLADNPPAAVEHPLIEYVALVREHWATIAAIKALLADTEFMKAQNLWHQDIPQADRLVLWRAPSKGGIFETWERAALRESALAEIEQEA